MSVVLVPTTPAKVLGLRGVVSRRFGLLSLKGVRTVIPNLLIPMSSSTRHAW